MAESIRQKMKDEKEKKKREEWGKYKDKEIKYNDFAHSLFLVEDEEYKNATDKRLVIPKKSRIKKDEEEFVVNKKAIYVLHKAEEKSGAKLTNEEFMYYYKQLDACFKRDQITTTKGKRVELMSDSVVLITNIFDVLYYRYKNQLKEQTKAVEDSPKTNLLSEKNKAKQNSNIVMKEQTKKEKAKLLFSSRR